MISNKRFTEIIQSFAQLPGILVIGDVGIDKYTLGKVRRISPEAPVPILEVEKEWPKLGLAANIAHNMRTLHIPCTLCGVIGDDARAEIFEQLIEDQGLKTWGLVRDPERPTIFKERITTEGQQICRIDYEKNELLSPAMEKKFLERVFDLNDGHKGVIIEDYAKGTLTPDVLVRLIAEFKNRGLMIGVDPGRQTNPLLYKGAHLLKPNYQEALLMVDALGGQSRGMTLSEMAEFLLEKLDLEKIVITLGKDGQAFLDKLESKPTLKTIPTLAREVFDVSGAGDTTMTLLMASLLAGATLEEAVWVSNCGAGVVVGKVGTATVNQLELQQFYAHLEATIK